eukprot:1971897-Amphidinium_carterae.1
MSVLTVFSDWLLTRLHAVAESELPTESEVSCVWSHSGIAEQLEVFTASRLEKRHVSGVKQRNKKRQPIPFNTKEKQEVSRASSTLEADGSLDKLSTCLLECWRYTDWTRSRWATIGACARNVVIGFLLGSRDMFSFMAAAN